MSDVYVPIFPYVYFRKILCGMRYLFNPLS